MLPQLLTFLCCLMLVIGVVAFGLGLWGSRHNDCGVQPKDRACVMGKRPAFWYSLSQISFIGAIALCCSAKACGKYMRQ